MVTSPFSSKAVFLLQPVFDKERLNLKSCSDYSLYRALGWEVHLCHVP